MKIKAVWDKANSLRGCLSGLKTHVGLRRWSPEEDEDGLILNDGFIWDEAKIVASKAWRAAAGKTQVFSFPETPLIRSRLAHMTEVGGVSVMASEMLGLNTNLMRAAAYAHDLGHTPFGHQGEKHMKKLLGPGFSHESMGVVICQKIERGGAGLNLTWPTLRMIARHAEGSANLANFPELELIGLTDGITYLLHDANDIGRRQGYVFCKELKDVLAWFGASHRERTNTIVGGLVIESAEKKRVSFQGSEIAQKFIRLRELMYDVYHRVTQQNVEPAMNKVFECLKRLDLADPCMLLALMTDRDVAIMAEAIMPDMQVFKRTAVSEILPRLEEIHRRHGKIDLCDLDLKW